MPNDLTTRDYGESAAASIGGGVAVATTWGPDSSTQGDWRVDAIDLECDPVCLGDLAAR